MSSFVLASGSISLRAVLPLLCFLCSSGCLAASVSLSVGVGSHAIHDSTSTPPRSVRKQSLRSLQRRRRKPEKRVLAFYFPQFHEVEENSQAWGPGFTDFTNVEKAQEDPLGMPVVKPAETAGFYDLTDMHRRRSQADLAHKFGIDGFVFMHYWFSDHAVMDKPLKLMMEDGEPDIDFCLMWANEPWTRRWDGLPGPDMILEQTYHKKHWEAHWKWLLIFLKHDKYIRVDGKAMLIVYRAHDVPGFSEMIEYWQQLAKGAGLLGLHVVQMNGVEWKRGSMEAAEAVDATLEYYPNMYNGGQLPVEKVITTPKSSKVHYYGAHISWNNFPRHLKDGKHSYQVMHPSVYKYVLRQNLARTKPGGFVFVNAWNEWGEGAALEPSVQWGRRWLQATRDAVDEERHGQAAMIGKDGHAMALHIPAAGVPPSPVTKAQVCIIVRTYKGHSTGQYNIHQLLHSLRGLTYVNWKAYIAATDKTPFDMLATIVDSFNDDRMQVVEASKESLEDFTWQTAGFRPTDELISQHCLNGQFRWLLITNGDNWYAPDALNYLPNKADIVFMNFYGRYSPINDIFITNATLAAQPAEDCCMRFNHMTCQPAAPAIGLVDLGGAVLNAKRYASEKRTFMQYQDACSHSCHDGALVNALYKEGWSYVSHPLDVCAFYHNANFMSCAMIGGVYYDSNDYYRVGCYELTTGTLPLELNHINYNAFIQSDRACVCPRRHLDGQG